jgi:apolipoprotein D and lipocalin family protein
MRERILKIFSLFMSVLLLVSCSKPMPPAASEAIVQSVDANQYLGTWYEIARFENSFEKGLERVTANYSLNEDGTIKVVNRGFNVKDSKWEKAIGKAKFVDAANADGSRTGRLKVSFFGPFYGDYNIIELDKAAYKYVLVSSGSEYLWILSRTPQLATPTQEALVAKAKKLGFETEKLVYVKHE